MLGIFTDPIRKWERTLYEPLNPEDQVEFYETRLLDPTIDLSAAEKAEINSWMIKSEHLSPEEDDQFNFLTEKEIVLINQWMSVSESLPLEMVAGPATLFEYLEDLWNGFAIKYYEWKYSGI